MSYQRELNFLINVFKKCNINVLLFDPEQSAGKNIGAGIRKFLDEETANIPFEQAVGGMEERVVYRLKDNFQCQYMFLKLPDGQVLLTGPYIMDEISGEWVMELAESLGMAPGETDHLEKYYRDIPVLRENSRIFAVIDTFCEVIWQGSGYRSVSINKGDDPIFSSLSLASGTFGERDCRLEMEMMEKRYAYENQLMDAVYRGQSHKVQILIEPLSQMAFEQRIPDTLRNTKNYMIIMNTLLRKSAEKGGVHPLYLDRISSGYAVEIESLKTVKMLPDLMKRMFEDYCSLVNKHKTGSYSSLIKNVIIYIDSDLAGDLSLKSLADLNGVSAGYLSTCFRKETGKTFVDYVSEKRIDMAKHLLKTTGLQIQTIAQHCGFLDMQYFSKVFKKYTQRTPREYREYGKIKKPEVDCDKME